VFAKDWFTTTEVAEALGFSDRWVRRQIELGRLKAVAFDAGSRRSLRIHRHELAAFRSRYLHDATELPPPSER
jgi:excisionase family DNA binding protein